MRNRDTTRYVYGHPSSGHPAYVIKGAYIHEYPHGPAVFVALGGVWYDCAKPFEARFRVRDGRVYDAVTGLLRYRAATESAAQQSARPARRGGMPASRRRPPARRAVAAVVPASG